jgi:hypothetical protein
VKQGLTDFGAQTLDLAFEPLDGVHDLIMTFRNEDEGGLVCIGISYDLKRGNRPSS